MQLLNRFLVWLTAALTLAGFELAWRQPRQAFAWLIFLLIVVLVTLWQLTGRHLGKAIFWQLAITPIFLLLASWLFFIFSEATKLRHVYILSWSLLLFVFLQAVYLYWHQRPRYQVHSLENISNYLNVLTIFLFFVGLFDLKIILQFDFWGLFLIGLIGAVLLTYELFAVSGISFRQQWPTLAVLGLLLAELSWAVSFLPTSVYVNGLIITLFYYLLTGLTRNWLLQIQERGVVVRYLLIGVLSLVIILASAKWF